MDSTWIQSRINADWLGARVIQDDCCSRLAVSRPYKTQSCHARNQRSARQRRRQEILKGISLTVERRARCTPSWAPTDPARARSRRCSPGNPAYEVTGGTVTYDGKDLLAMAPEVRAQAGIFLAFQYPVEIPGVSNAYFLRSAYNEIRKARGEEEVDPLEFLDLHGGEARSSSTWTSAMLQPLGEHGLLRRREEAQRDPADGRARAAGSRSSTRPIRGSTSTRCASSPTA